MGIWLGTLSTLLAYDLPFIDKFFIHQYNRVLLHLLQQRHQAFMLLIMLHLHQEYIWDLPLLTTLRRQHTLRLMALAVLLLLEVQCYPVTICLLPKTVSDILISGLLFLM